MFSRICTTAPLPRAGNLARTACGSLILACTFAAFSSSTMAAVSNSRSAQITIGANTPYNRSAAGSAAAINFSDTYQETGLQATITTTVTQTTLGAVMSLTGTAPAVGRTGAAAQFSYTLTPPAGAQLAGGKMILHGVINGTVAGNASLVMSVQNQGDSTFLSGTGMATLSDPNVRKQEFDVPADVPTGVTGAVTGTLRITLQANAALPGTTNATVFADGSSGSSVTGFRVLNAAGTQITGFTMNSDVGVVPELTSSVTPPAGGSATTIVEFYAASLDHYFISLDAAEIAALDNHTIPGWARTGLTFKGYVTATTGANPVCRFYIPPARGDSHFFSASPSECASVLTFSTTPTDPHYVNYSGFVYESPNVFYMPLPDTTNGACPGGTIPVYRLFNARADANHRYTTDAAVKAQMIAKGYIAEGYGSDAVIMCSPQ